MRCLQKYTPSFLTSSNITLAKKTKAKTYKYTRIIYLGQITPIRLSKALNFYGKLSIELQCLFSWVAPVLGFLSVTDTPCYFDPFCHTRGALIFVVLRDVLRVLASPWQTTRGGGVVIKCPNQNTTFNLRRELGSFLKNVSRVYITGTCEKDEIYKCYDVNYRISRISLSPLELFSQYLFSFYINLRNSGGIKMYILLNLYKVVEYIYTEELKRRIF